MKKYLIFSKIPKIQLCRPCPKRDLICLQSKISFWGYFFQLKGARRRYHEKAPNSMRMRHLSCEGICIFLWYAPKSNTFILGLCSKTMKCPIFPSDSENRGISRKKHVTIFWNKKGTGNEIHRFWDISSRISFLAISFDKNPYLFFVRNREVVIFYWNWSF